MTRPDSSTTKAGADFAQSPRIPADQAGPIFAEPWHAQAFAMAVSLHASGVFSWADWAAALSRRIGDAADADGAALGEAQAVDWNDRYYRHWLAALEEILIARAIADPDQITRVASEWRAAYLRTPDGQPVALE